jgi:twitching motility protein PilI
MKPNGKNSAFAKLVEFDRRSTGYTPGQKDGEGPSREWSGVTFGVGDFRMTCNIDRISEILPCPQATPVPGAKSWIVGLANVRGELLTVVDLAWFLTGTRTPLTKRSRLLATSLNKAPIGLLIDEVFGQRHFLDDDARQAELPEDSPMTGIVNRQYQLGSEFWHELDLNHLFNSTEFLNGAANPEMA